jgi:(p)ppGpp synthase/HD superfamily hydrolase
MPSTARFCEALEYAVQLHAGQRRKGSATPYVAHLLSVTAIVLEHGASEDEAIAALLHDAVEDQGGSPVREEIRRRFGPVVAAIVDGCSDSETIPKPPWRERKQKFLAQLPSAGRSVHLVTAADKLHNIRSLVDDYREHGESLWDRFSGGREGTLWYYRAVVDLLASSLPGPLVEKLGRAVSELERIAVERDI